MTYGNGTGDGNRSIGMHTDYLVRSPLADTQEVTAAGARPGCLVLYNLSTSILLTRGISLPDHDRIDG
jgi:hypothetical protein